jgi:hypothetical protein
MKSAITKPLQLGIPNWWLPTERGTHRCIPLWLENLPSILAASQLALDADFKLQTFTAVVLDEISPRLPRSVKTSIPNQNAAVARLLSKLQQRIAYLQHPSAFATPPPPITITVLGGSVTVGKACWTEVYRIRDQRCSWPVRLGEFINAAAKLLMGPNIQDLVRVHTMAVGGTNTAMGQAVLEYNLLPPEAASPDVLINSYSTNDMHVLTMLEATETNMTLRDKVFHMCQEFARTVLGQCSDIAPVLLWLDDYLGNEQREIMATQELAQSLHVLANYYGFGFLSYADAVRDIVYGDTRETLFSPAGWYAAKDRPMKREIHHGQGSHMSMAWIVAYYLLSTVTTHCSLIEAPSRSAKNRVFEDARNDFQTQMKDGGVLPAAGRHRLTSIPPPLYANSALDTVSQKWEEQNAAGCHDIDLQRCPFSWVSGMPWKDIPWIQSHFSNIVQQPSDWDAIDDTNGRGKIGWMPKTNTTGSKLVMELHSTAYATVSQIQTVTLFYYKSYGPKWDNSTVAVHVEWKLASGPWISATDPFALNGFHAKNTTETYTDTIHLTTKNENEKSTGLRVSLTLAGGNTFKLSGIAVCK